MRRRGRLALALVGLPAAGALVLAVEVRLARTGPELAPAEPFSLDRVVGAGDGPPLRMVWIGDSTAAGVGASGVDAALPVVVAAGVRRNVSLTVLAESGATVADVVRDQAPRVSALDPDVVLVSVGANDVTHFTRVDAFREGYRRLTAFGDAKVVALGIPDMGSPPRLAQPLRALTGWRGRRLDSAVRDLAATRPEVRFVDIAGHTGPAFRADPGRYFAADRYHPSDAGYRLWAEAVLAALE